MNSHKGVSRTLLKDFDTLEDNEPKNDPRDAKIKQPGMDLSNLQGDIPHRDYQTRQRTSSNSYRDGGGATGKAALKPRQENSLGELTKKFINLIKATDDY